jgi:hypothetical protein
LREWRKACEDVKSLGDAQNGLIVSVHRAQATMRVSHIPSSLSRVRDMSQTGAAAHMNGSSTLGSAWAYGTFDPFARVTFTSLYFVHLFTFRSVVVKTSVVCWLVQ